jgi:lysophospholipase L1-like esterase
MKRVFLILLLTLSLLVSCDVKLSETAVPGEHELAATVGAADTKSYLILGDSIAAHYGVSEKDSYEYKLAELLRSDGEKWVGTNWGVSGYTTGDLVTLLTKCSEEPDKRAILENADLICISIGGNNLLRFLREHGMDGFPTDGSSVDWVKLSKVFSEGSEELCTELKSDLETIMKTVRAINPDAVVLVQNIHNVARDMRGTFHLFGAEISPTALTDPLFRPIIRTIADNASALGYTVADTYAAFAESPEGGLLRRELIHPNADGHTLIAQVLYDAYRAQTGKTS